MLDKAKYWLDLAEDDISVAELLLAGNKYLQAGFFCHLTAEKALKAVIAHETNETPPKIHNLITLAKHGKIFPALSNNQLLLLNDLMPLQIEARYPEYKKNIAETLSNELCKRLLEETEAFLCWIKQELGK